MTPTHKAKILFPAVGATLLVSAQAATQQLASSFHYPIEFGRGLFDLGAVRAYAPWDIVRWYDEFGSLYPDQFNTASTLAFGLALAPILVAVGVSRRTKLTPKPFGTEAWATLEDVTAANLIRDDGMVIGRVLGRYKGRMLTFNGVEHTLVVGGTRSGKGGLVITTACAYPGSAFFYDRKGEIYAITADHRKRFSHVIRFEPTDPLTVRWNPLFEIRKGPMEVADTQNVVGILADPLGAKNANFDYWDKEAMAFFVGLILHVLYAAPDDKKNLAHVRRLLINIGPTIDAMAATLHRNKPDLLAPDGLARDADGEPIPEIHPEVELGVLAYHNMSENVRTGVLGTARSFLTLFADPLVAHATSWSDFRLSDIVCSDNPVSFYLVTPMAHADRLAFLVRIMLRQTVNAMMESLETDNRGRPKKHRMLLLLDEFPKLGKLPFLQSAFGEMCSYGISGMLVCQSFSDIFDVYGERTSFFDNIHVTSAFATATPRNQMEVVQRAGKARELRESYSDPRSFFGNGHRTRSLSEKREFILSEEDVRALDERKQYIFAQNTKPIIADKIRYYEEPYFRAITRDIVKGETPIYQQDPRRPDGLDLPGKAVIDWAGVRAIEGFEPLAVEEPQAPAAGPPHEIPLPSLGRKDPPMEPLAPRRSDDLPMRENDDQAEGY